MSVPSKPELCSLEHAMSYEFPNLIYKFMEKYSISEEEAEKIFMDVKIWLWLNIKARHDEFKGLVINEDLFMLDEMWHAFILFTPEYTQYCTSRFGRYIHHSPTTKADKDAFRELLRTEPDTALRTITESQNRQYEYVLDALGIEVLERWYLYYPSTYHRGVREEIRVK